MSPRDHALSVLKFTRSVSDGILKGFPDDKLTFQNHPHENHALWALAHLASTDAWINGLVSAPSGSIPDAVGKCAGPGTKPVSDPKQYPPAAEVRRAYESSRAALIRWLETAPDSALDIDIKDKTGGFATTPLDAVFKIIWHEGWHMGQVATIRKSLGLPPTMG
jgi:hypothetical protein